MTSRKKSAVKFAEPPPERGAPYNWDLIARKLRRKPEEWARIYEHDRYSYANAIRQGAVAALAPSKGFEIRTANNRRTSPRMCDLWMRYVPANDQQKEDR